MGSPVLERYKDLKPQAEAPAQALALTALKNDVAAFNAAATQGRRAPDRREVARSRGYILWRCSSARRFLVSGRVQGVGFRFFARRLPGRGPVQAGSETFRTDAVEALAEGDAGGRRRFGRQLARGPAMARV